jgi:Ca2+-transporting ATPase
MSAGNNLFQGLSDAEASQRLRRDGPNRLARSERRGLYQIALGVAVQPMFLLLLATSLVYAVLGQAGDAAVLLVSVLAVGGISLVQEYRTERVLDALRDLSSPRARVMRDGRVCHIPSTALVCGDCLLVGEGDRMACDALILQGNGLTVDESLLTGESAPVLKAARKGPDDASPGHSLYAGSLLVAGDGVALVSATGQATALGRIGGTLASIERRPGRVQLELKAVVARVAAAAVLASFCAALLYAYRQGSWLDGLLAGLTLAMAIIPEEFAVVWAVMLSLGAWRLAKVGVLTRQAQAIETLGTTTVLCVDKTGTLTENRMQLVTLATPVRQADLAPDACADAEYADLLDAAARASIEMGIDPMDKAILRVAERSYGRPAALPVLLGRECVAAGRPWFSARWRLPEGGGELLAIKGAPEAVLDLCELTPAERTQVSSAVERLCAQGLRVLGVARSHRSLAQAPDEVPPKAQWLGLLGFLDPVRQHVPAAMRQCREAGMRVVMITGDSSATAVAIARHAGLAAAGSPVRLISGRELTAMSDTRLARLVMTTSIFARVAPEQKLRIVRALQARGEVVAMTGDGVNDAAALRAADIGVAMGRRGTDVAREAAALVLLEDSFAALVGAVRMGRRIFGNLHHAVGYLIAVHVPIVAISLLPVLLGGPVLLLPLHVVLLELIIDPACSLVFEAEPEPADCMRRSPRPAGVGLLSTRSALRALGIGALAAVFSAGTVLLCRWTELDTAMTRMLALLSLIAGNLLMLAWYRHGKGEPRGLRGNRAFAWLLVGVCALLAVVALLGSFLPQLGLPEHWALRPAGLALGLSSLLAAGLLWHRHGTELDEASLDPAQEDPNTPSLQ